eukprot:366017-Chlamydomonas_euryale.AAC.6
MAGSAAAQASDEDGAQVWHRCNAGVDQLWRKCGEGVGIRRGWAQGCGHNSSRGVAKLTYGVATWRN